jgi:hypothetical protein
MLLRFVVSRRNTGSGKRQGLFQAGVAVRDAADTPIEMASRFQEIFDWFDRHLEKPARFALSRRPHARAQAISWFKGSATEHLRQMRKMQFLLEENGICVEILRTDRPGYVVYEDEFQVTAYPFSDTPA